MNKILPFVYRYILIPLAYLGLHIAQFRNAKIKQGLAMRKNKPWAKKRFKDALWIHCASGEFEYAKPIIREMKKRYADHPVIVTYFSPSSQKNIENFPGVDLAVPTPYETPSAWREFLSHHTPLALLIPRTDLWPEMLMQTKNMGIPILHFSATLVDDSARMKPYIRPFYSWAVQNITDIFCVAKEDVENFKKIGYSKAQIQGDTRFDQVFERLSNPKPIKIDLFRGKMRDEVFVAGSTWEEDEDVIVTVLSKFKELSTVIAPHEPSEEHLDLLERKLQVAGLSSCRYSQVEEWNTNVLIIDEIGILADLYGRGSYAFVGGSYKKSVHSVMEPLAAGCLTFLGPYHLNNREAIEFTTRESNGIRIVTVAAGPREFSKLLKRHIESQKTLACNIEIQNIVREKTGGSAAVIDWLESAQGSKESASQTKKNTPRPPKPPKSPTAR